jgi:hypothetical protein
MALTLSTLADSALKMRWKEPYASDGVNRKYSHIVPRGIVRGFRLEKNATDSRVDLKADTEEGDHVANYTDASGRSVSVFLSGDLTGFNLTALKPLSDSIQVIIALSVSYTVGAPTTATLVAYTAAEWAALSDAQRKELLACGEVTLPASDWAGAGAVSPNKRVAAALQMSHGLAPWVDIIRNGSFEHVDAVTAAVKRALFWRYNQANTNISVDDTEANAHAGAHAMKITQGVDGTALAINQGFLVPVAPGTMLHACLWVKGANVPAGTKLRIYLATRDKNAGSETQTYFDLDVPAGTFAHTRLEVAWRQPANQQFLSVFGFCPVFPSLTVDATKALWIDDVRVRVERIWRDDTGESAPWETLQGLKLRQLVLEPEGSTDELADQWFLAPESGYWRPYRRHPSTHEKGGSIDLSHIEELLLPPTNTKWLNEYPGRRTIPAAAFRPAPDGWTLERSGSPARSFNLAAAGAKYLEAPLDGLAVGSKLSSLAMYLKPASATVMNVKLVRRDVTQNTLAEVVGQIDSDGTTDYQSAEIALSPAHTVAAGYSYYLLVASGTTSDESHDCDVAYSVSSLVQ